MHLQFLLAFILVCHRHSPSSFLFHSVQGVLNHQEVLLTLLGLQFYFWFSSLPGPLFQLLTSFWAGSI